MSRIWFPPSPKQEMTDARSRRTAEFCDELNGMLKTYSGEDFSLMDAVAALETTKVALLLNEFRSLGI